MKENVWACRRERLRENDRRKMYFTCISTDWGKYPLPGCRSGKIIRTRNEKYRKDIQLIFQDPYGSLDPRQNMASIIREAIRSGNKTMSRAEENEQIERLLLTVELDPAMKDRYAHEMSGGQRQRLGIARALACSPKIIVCDEPVSALDVSIQAQIINLFARLQKQKNLSYLFIAHDLAVVKHIADVIAVMYLGHIVEIVEAEEIYKNPLHPYTKALMSAVPTTDYYVEKNRERIFWKERCQVRWICRPAVRSLQGALMQTSSVVKNCLS